MTEASGSQSKPNITRDLVEIGKKAFDPSLDPSSRQIGLQEFNSLLGRTNTWTLLPALNTLIKPGVLPPWLHDPLMQALTMLPLRSNGVRATMEFIFSVHPTNSARAPDSTSPQKQGGNITHEAVAVATKLLSSVPTSMTPQQWFEGISGQLFNLIDGGEGADLARPAAQIVGFGILGQKRYGAPGTPGWNVFVQPLLQHVNPSLGLSQQSSGGAPADGSVSLDANIIDLTTSRILVTARDLERAVKRLKVLVHSNPSPGLCRRILRPAICQLASLASKDAPGANTTQTEDNAHLLLQTWLRLFGDREDAVLLLFSDVVDTAPAPEANLPWKYTTSKEGIEVIATTQGGSSAETNMWQGMEEKIETVAKILATVCSPETTSSIFLSLLHKWMKHTEQHSDVEIPTSSSTPNQDSSISSMIEMSLLQKLLDKSPEKLVSHFDQLLDLICSVLASDTRSRVSDESISLILSLLNLVITAPSFKRSDIKRDGLQTIESALDRLSREDRPQISQTATNLALLLKYRGEYDESEDSIATATSRQIEDRRAYNLAMNYITGADNPPPVVSEGLNILSGLITSNSSMLDITAIVVLLSNLLKDSEDYITLRVVKMFTQLAQRHPKTVVRELLDSYIDAQEKSFTDTRLRFGEALLQVVERLGETFTGEVATDVGESLLSVASRRGYRPKTLAKQEREQRLKDLKKKKKAVKTEEEPEEDEQMDDDEELTEQERANNEILEQIVQGWDSKRGAEDVRMRASSLSIFGSALETNIAGIGTTLVSAGVDLSVSILTLEPEMEKGILRRAAVLVILGFVRALQSAREAKKSLGFGLTDQSREDISRTLRYVATVDSDGLVKQHANDVVESLENWHATSLLAPVDEMAPPELGALRGLQLQQPSESSGTAGHSRPRIEEIE